LEGGVIDTADQRQDDIEVLDERPEPSLEEKLDIKGIIYRRAASFVITRGGLPYEVIEADPLWPILQEYIAKNPSLVEAEAPHFKSIDQLTQEARDHRDALLSISDFSQLADAPVDKEAWATYRQALRDVPEQKGFPNTITWPVRP
jgi:hypothetical protein